MNVLRHLRPECIALDVDFEPAPMPEAETPGQRESRLVADKEALLQLFSDLLDKSGEIVNPSKFYRDLVNRERKATTGIAPGIAIPHVRSMQARSFIMGFARARAEGVPFSSLDGTPTKLFFLLAAPPYEDKLYLQVYREIAEMIQRPEVVDGLLTAHAVQDVMNVLRGYFNR